MIAPPKPFPVTKLTSEKFLKMLIYAPPGSGKTTLASTAQDVPEMQDVLFMDAEAGTLSLRHRDDITIVRVERYSVFADVCSFLNLHTRYRDAGDMEDLAKLNEKYDIEQEKVFNTVVIDSLTEVQVQLMRMLLGDPDADISMVPKTPEYKEWLQSAQMVRKLVRAFRDLPLHVIIVCAEAEFENERKMRIKRPNLPGKLAGEVQGFVDCVGYLAVARGGEEDVTRRRLYITSGNTFQAKHRFGQIETEFIDDPSMIDLWRLANA